MQQTADDHFENVYQSGKNALLVYLLLHQVLDGRGRTFEVMEVFRRVLLST